MVHPATTAAYRGIPRDRDKALQISQGSSRIIPEPLRGSQEEVLPRYGLDRGAPVHQLLRRSWCIAEDLQQLLEALPPPAPDLDFAAIIEIVDKFGVRSIGVASSGRETVVLAELEVHAPGVIAGVQQPSRSKAHRRCVRPGFVAETTRVEAVPVLIHSLVSLTDGHEVLDSREPRPFDSMGGQICLVQKAKGAGEPELPADAGTIGAITMPALCRDRGMTALDFIGRREGPWRQDAHVPQGAVGLRQGLDNPFPVSRTGPRRGSGGSSRPLLSEEPATARGGSGPQDSGRGHLRSVR